MACKFLRKSTIDSTYQDEEEGEYNPQEQEEEPEEEKQMIFMIEFLVESLSLKMYNWKLDNVDPCYLQGETSLKLKFLDFPEMTIGEKDIDHNKRTGCDDMVFKTGKSTTFAMPSSKLDPPPDVYLNITGAKKMPHGVNPSVMYFGFVSIDLSELFKKVFEKTEDEPEKLPLSKSSKDTYNLLTDDDKIAAKMSLYVRLTCLGENIVTEFQRNDEEPMLFKNIASQKLYKCSTQDVEERPGDMCPACPGWGKALGGWPSELEKKNSKSQRSGSGTSVSSYGSSLSSSSSNRGPSGRARGDRKSGNYNRKSTSSGNGNRNSVSSSGNGNKCGGPKCCCKF